MRSFFFCTIVLAVLPIMRWLFVNEVILLERSPWSKVLGRSSRLSRDRGSELLGTFIGQVAFGGLFLVAVLYAETVLRKIFPTRASWEMPSLFGRFVRNFWGGPPGWAFRLAVWSCIAFFTITRFLTYIDQRIRLEGWEIALRLRSAGAAMAEAERW